jgi:hypothetical protein
MADFIKPAARAHWYDTDSDMEWGTCGPEDEAPVWQFLLDQEIPHPLWAASPAEAAAFWLAGGWDD